MNVRRRLLIVFVVAATSMASALAAVAASSSTRLISGTWKLTRDFPYLSTAGGGFKITRDATAVSSLTITPSDNAAADCGADAGDVRVLGRHQLKKRTGRSGWFVGTRAPETKTGIAPKNVQVIARGKTVDGTLQMTFDRTSGGGRLDFAECRLRMEAKKGR